MCYFLSYLLFLVSKRLKKHRGTRIEKTHCDCVTSLVWCQCASREYYWNYHVQLIYFSSVLKMNLVNIFTSPPPWLNCHSIRFILVAPLCWSMKSQFWIFSVPVREKLIHVHGTQSTGSPKRILLWVKHLMDVCVCEKKLALVLIPLPLLHVDNISIMKATNSCSATLNLKVDVLP